jgi:2-(1,2-epoxy-1,2-dihydrophenyl)acetyl-CoA isomerase
MPYETILFTVEGGVARLTFNRPDKLNSFNAQMHAEVHQALGSLTEGDARVLVLSGTGRGFCAGQDLGERKASLGRSRGPDLGESIEKYYKPLVLTLKSLQMPVVAAVNGVAAGAGANIALACDLVVAARSANFIQSFSKLGLLPDCGGTWTLPRLVGPARALGLTLLGDKLSAEQAAAWGLIWLCVDDEQFALTVSGLAARLAAAPTRALAWTKKAINASWQRSLSEQLDLERDAQRELGYSEDYVEGVAAFGEKRAPVFAGR